MIQPPAKWDGRQRVFALLVFPGHHVLSYALHKQAPQEGDIMKNKFRLRMFSVAVVLTALLAGQVGYGQAKKGTQTDPCSTASLPAEIQNKLTTKYAGWKILTQAWAIELHA